MNTCQACGKPLPTAARTGRPRNTCNDRCRKSLSRHNKVTKEFHPSASTIALYAELIAACQASETSSAQFTTDCGDGSDVAELVTYARIQDVLSFRRDNRNTATFWL